MGLQNKHIWITGASSGIGEAAANVFAESGSHLVLGARRHERLKALLPSLLEKGAKSVTTLPLDVCEQSSVDSFIKEGLEQSGGKIDALLNNAGLALGKAPIETGEWQDLQTMIDTNVLGVLRVTRGLLPSLKNNPGSTIVMTGSIAGHQVYEGGAVYCASKYALRAITDGLRLEVNGTTIRVCSVDPGMVATEFSNVRLRDDEAAAHVYDGLTPLAGRDIADAIHFIVSRPAHVCINDLIIMPTAQASVNKVTRSQ